MSLGKLILKRKKAVSPVIATILLIALTVTAAAIVYFVVVPMLEGKPSLAIRQADFVISNSSKIEITVENIGNAAATFDAFTAFQLINETGTYNPAEVQIGGLDPIAFPHELGTQQSVIFELAFAFHIDILSTYTIKVICAEGISATIAFPT
ncbi:MAG: archaellin/type IV pilin N-terminal domain-containing protein [Candidatus Heimdallarchaeota archaeon]